MKSRRYATRRLMRRLEKLKAYFLSRYSEARARADGLGDPAQLTAATWEASTWDEAIGFLSEIVDGKQSSIGARGIGVSHVSENGLHRLPSHLMAHLGIPNGGAVYVTAEISPGVVTIESEDMWLKRAGLGDEDSMPEDYAHGFKTGDVVVWTLDKTSRSCDLIVRRAYAASVVVQKAGKGEGDEWRAFHAKPEELQRVPPGVNDWVRDIRYPRDAPVSFSAGLHEQRLYYVRVAPPKQEAASADFKPGDIVTTLELDGVARYVVKSVSLAGSSVDIITNQDGLTKTIEPKFLRRPDVREGDWVRCPECPQGQVFTMSAFDTTCTKSHVSKFVPVVTHFPSAPTPAAPQEIKVGDTVERAGNSGAVTGVRWDHLTVETDRGTRYWRHDEVTAQTPEKETQVPITPAPETAVQNTPMKQLRIGFFNDKKLVKENAYQPGPGKIVEYVLISEHVSIRLTPDGCTMQFTEQARGRVGAGSITRDLVGLREGNVAKNDGARWIIELTEDMHGLLELDSHVTVAFKFVSGAAPALDSKPESTAVPEMAYNASDHFARLNELSRATPEPNPEPAPSPTEPSGPQGDEEVSVDHTLFNAFATIASSLEPESQASDPSDVYDQLVSGDYCNKFIEGSSLKKPARVGDLFVSDGKAFMVRLQENYKKPSTPTVERVTLHMGYLLSHGLNNIRQGDAIAAKINRALVPAILMPETMDGKCPEVERPDRVLSVGTLVKMPDGRRGVVMGYHDGAYMIQRELFRCGHGLLKLELGAAKVPAPESEPKNRVRPRKPGPNQVIELHQSVYLPDSVNQDEELVLRELDTNSNAGWWTAWWPRKAAVVRIRLSDWEPVTGTASAPPSPGLVFAVNLVRYRLSPVGKHALVGVGPLTLHSTIDSAQQQVARHRVLSPRWTEETPRLWISERGADDTVLRIEITEEKVQ